jgi:hypothetical protein
MMIEVTATTAPMINAEQAAIVRDRFTEAMRLKVADKGSDPDKYVSNVVKLVKADVMDVLNGKMWYMHFIGNDKYALLQLDKKTGKIPAERVLWFRAMVAYAESMGVKLVYKISYDETGGYGKFGAYAPGPVDYDGDTTMVPTITPKRQKQILADNEAEAKARRERHADFIPEY